MIRDLLVWIRNRVSSTGGLPSRLVLDLDAVLTENVAFTFQGVDYVIPPISTRDFVMLSEALVNMDDLSKRDKLETTEVIDTYYRLLRSICPTIRKRHIASMTQPQLIRLRQLVLDCANGKIYAQAAIEKKNEARSKASVH